MEAAGVADVGAESPPPPPPKLSTASHHQQHQEDQRPSSSMQQQQQHPPPEQQQGRHQQGDRSSSTAASAASVDTSSLSATTTKALSMSRKGRDTASNRIAGDDAGATNTTPDVTTSSTSPAGSAAAVAVAAPVAITTIDDHDNDDRQVEDDANTNVDTTTDTNIVVELPTYTNITLKLPTPVLVASLPKSGTVSVWRYFLCGGQKASHLYAKLNGTVDFNPVGGGGGGDAKRTNNKQHQQNQKQMISGQCMRRNYISQRPLLHNCGNYDIWSDTGYIKIPPTPHHCYYPNIHGLDAWYESYPHSTILLVKRDPVTWSRSIQNWGNGALLKRWRICRIPGFIDVTNASLVYNSIENLIRFYNWHVNFIRNFTRTHPTLTYVETSLEDPTISNILQTATNIPASCWAKCNPTTDTSSCVRAK